MFSIKDFARKFSQKEIAEIKDELSDSKERNAKLNEEIENLRNRNKVLSDEIAKVELEKSEAQKRFDEIQKENGILRKYYDLDKEPSDEIKIKIHIDLEINRVKEENLKLIAMLKSLSTIQWPCPIYTPTYGRMFY